MKLPATILAAALFALLAFAPFASAASDPVASGSATVTLKSGFAKSLKKAGVKISKVGSAKVNGSKLTFKVTGGELDPTNGQGTLTLGGGLKLKHGKKSTSVKGLSLDTIKKGLFGKVAGKKVKITTVGGYTFARAGFGVSLVVKKMKLTNTAAKKLNKALGTKAFKGNKLIASGVAEEQPATVAIIPGGNVSFNANKELLEKLKNVKTAVEPIAPTSVTGTTFEFPISGGSIAPTATAGVVQTIGGAKLFQKLPKNEAETEFYETEITLGNFWLDLSAHTVTVEVVAKSNASEKLNLGALGRSSIADLTLTGATVTIDATNHKVTVTNAQATLQPISAEVLQGFVSVYKGFVEAVTFAKVCAALPEKCKEPAEQEIAKAKSKEEGEKVEQNHISAGNPLGTFSFTAQTQ
ncbi:MAG TPA: HtaA domain-containing protein [Solirubrobacterales bacterium]|nr:HtaA domain-containing protein [Solirubrobacterales bacterium]